VFGETDAETETENNISVTRMIRDHPVAGNPAMTAYDSLDTYKNKSSF
jgi:hypothetical protein